MIQHEWQLKRNCSFTPRNLALAYAVLCIASLAVAAAFLFHGAWYVLVYSIFELTIVAVAFLCYARHATDQEHIVLAEDYLLVERILGGQVQQIRLDPYWTKITLPRHDQDLIHLQSRGRTVEVGRFVPRSVRSRVAHELRNELGKSAVAGANSQTDIAHCHTLSSKV